MGLAMNETGNDRASYGIGTVARLTGITTYTLRMWERRYGAVVAERAANGRRIYRAADVEKLSLLKTLTDRGTAISTVANLPLEALQDRVAQLDRMRAPALPAEVRTAVLGAFLPGMLEGEGDGAERLAVVASGSDLRRFRTDIRRTRPHALVLEVAVLDQQASRQIQELAGDSAAGHTVVVYGFGRSGDVHKLESSGMSLLRSPVTRQELVAAILGAGVTGKPGGRPSRHRPASGTSATRLDDLPARRYSPEQLARLSRIQSAIDCECPKHLADILNTLGAFEQYSQECEDLDDKDAALHAFLHASTARARALMEEALARVMEVENLQI
jgi:DNA-binding transcriptional MerR regulator